MDRVITAIESGKCAVAISGGLLRDADVMLATTDRASLPTMALSGPVVAPIRAVSKKAVAAPLAQPGGVVVLVDPQDADQPGLRELAQQLRRGPHTPTVLVVAQRYNPFLFQSLFSGLAVAHIKARGKQFIRDLPMPPENLPTPEVQPQRKQRGSDTNAPRFAFAGREEELATLKELLSSGGPIVVSGPQGGGRSWLVEHALADSELTRHPDLVLGWGCGADTLLARLAAICSEAGSDDLSKALGDSSLKPAEVIEAAVKSLTESETDGQVMVVREAQYGFGGRDADFFRKGRLEMLIFALCSHTYPLRLVMISTKQPVFFRHGITEILRRLPIGGIKGRFYYDIFNAYKAPDFPRDQFGPLSDKLHGHPLTVRQYAIEVRNQQDGLDLLENPKYLKMSDLEDIQPVRKLFGKRINKVKGDLRTSLSVAAHFRMPALGAQLANMGISRRNRLALLADGWLDMIGTETNKKYRVHPLARSCLSFREISDFDILEKLGDHYRRQGNDAQGVERIAMVQEANRCYLTGRNGRSRIKLKYPDSDPVLESVTSMLRSKKPNFHVAEARLREVLGNNPNNPNAHLLKIEFLDKQGRDKESLERAYDLAIEQAPVPEIFHAAATFHLRSRNRNKAAAILEKAVELMPNETRLRTRCAAVFGRVGRRKEAIEQLQKAMELDPMLPDAYGLLGLTRREEGIESYEEAEHLLREAVRLAKPGDPVQVPRLVSALLDRARVDAESREALHKEARDLLDLVIRGDRPGAESFIVLCQLTREEGVDLERCVWLLKQARKITDRNAERHMRINLEFALVDLARGELDKAEATVRDLGKRDPSNPEVFIALAKVLEARVLLIPAHAELLRAKERTGPNTWRRQFVEAELLRIQGLIESQVAGLGTPAETPAEDSQEESAEGAAGEATGSTAARVIRRRHGEDEVVAPEATAEDAPAADAEASSDEAPAEGSEAEATAEADAEADEAPIEGSEAEAASADEAEATADEAPIEGSEAEAAPAAEADTSADEAPDSSDESE